MTTAVKPASAFTVGFNNIPTNNTAGDVYASSFQLNVTDGGSGTVLFKFLNNLAANSAAATSFISDVYFENPGNLLSNMVLNVTNVGTVNFEVPNGNLNLSQGNSLTPQFAEAFGARNVPGTQGNASAVQRTEVLGVQFNGNYSNVLAALNNGTLRVGIHVQGLPGGASDSFVTNAVPEPFTMVGSGVALGIGAMMRKKQQKKKEKSIG